MQSFNSTDHNGNIDIVTYCDVLWYCSDVGAGLGVGLGLGHGLGVGLRRGSCLVIGFVPGMCLGPCLVHGPGPCHGHQPGQARVAVHGAPGLDPRHRAVRHSGPLFVQREPGVGEVAG